MTKATPQVIVAKSGIVPVVKMITRGRRAEGEDWSEVTIGVNPDTDEIETHTTPTEAPADGQAIIVPAMGNLSLEMTDYIIGEQRKRAEQRRAHPKRRPIEDMNAEIQAMWLDFVESKLKAFMRQSQFGPGGHTQRGDL